MWPVVNQTWYSFQSILQSAGVDQPQGKYPYPVMDFHMICNQPKWTAFLQALNQQRHRLSYPSVLLFSLTQNELSFWIHVYSFYPIHSMPIRVFNKHVFYDNKFSVGSYVIIFSTKISSDLSVWITEAEKACMNFLIKHSWPCWGSSFFSIPDSNLFELFWSNLETLKMSFVYMVRD